MFAALSLKQSTAAIGAWSGSRDFIASAGAVLLPPTIKEPITSKAILFMQRFNANNRFRVQGFNDSFKELSREDSTMRKRARLATTRRLSGSLQYGDLG